MVREVPNSSHFILTKILKYFSRLLNVHHTALLLMGEKHSIEYSEIYTVVCMLEKKVEWGSGFGPIVFLKKSLSMLTNVAF